jgi:ankyrin repeat protein
MRIGRLLGLVVILALVLAAVSAGQQQFQRQAFARAIRSGNWPAVRARLERGADLNTVSPKGITPLMVAAEAGDLEYVQKLLERGAKINAYDSHWRTPVDWAAKAGQSITVIFLLHRGAAVALDSSGVGKGPRHWALQSGNLPLHRELARREGLSRQMLDLCRDPKGPLPLERRLRDLLDRGAIVNGHDASGTALRWAAGRRDLEAAKLLLARNADPNFQVMATVLPLKEAVRTQDLAMARLLLERGADPNAPGLGPPVLSMAARLGNPELTRELIAAGAQVNHRFGRRDTPLSFAREANNSEVIRILTAAGGH